MAKLKKNEFFVKLSDIQPSQLYINIGKLEKVLEWIDPKEHNYDAVPIKEYEGKTVFTDGHTRAFALCLSDVDEIKVYWDEDELNDGVYKECINWCEAKGIIEIKDLQERKLTHTDFEKLWIRRCALLSFGLASNEKVEREDDECNE